MDVGYSLVGYRWCSKDRSAEKVCKYHCFWYRYFHVNVVLMIEKNKWRVKVVNEVNDELVEDVSIVHC